jgi:hypothetical protein
MMPAVSRKMTSPLAPEETTVGIAQDIDGVDVSVRVAA